MVFGFDARDNTININNTTIDTINLIKPDSTGNYHKPSTSGLINPGTIDGETKYYAMIGESLSNSQTSDSDIQGHDHEYYHIRIDKNNITNLNITSSLTIELKMFVNSIKGTTSPNMIFCRRSSYTNGIILFMNASDIVLGLGTGGSDRITFTNVIPLNEWIHLTITVTESQSILYINGVSQQSISSSEYTINLSNTDVSADLLVGSGNPAAMGLYTLDGYVQHVKFYNHELNSSQVESNSNEDVPCLTDSCNILTPKGYVNITSLKKGNMVTTHDKRNVPIIKLLKSFSKIPPNKIRSHQYGHNLPIIDTYISNHHSYQVNDKWLIPKNQNLPKKQSINNIYYHLQLPNYSTDHLIVNGLVMESWDGKLY